MAWIRNNCIQEEDTLTFELNGSCVSIEHLQDLIIQNQQVSISNSIQIQNLQNQLLDVNRLVVFLLRRCQTPCYNLCISPASTQIVALRPQIISSSTSTLSVRQPPQKIICEPVIVSTSKMVWKSYVYQKNGDIPILGIGNFKKVGLRLISTWNGKDLSEFLPVHFGKQVGSIVYMGIVNYRFIGKKAYEHRSFDEWLLSYQIYDTKTTETKIFEAGIFHWMSIADNKLVIF